MRIHENVHCTKRRKGKSKRNYDYACVMLQEDYMIHYPKMRILYVIDVVDLVIYLLNAMPKDTLKGILYINKSFKI